MKAYQQRVIDEKKELDAKCVKLARFLHSLTDKPDTVTADERYRLTRQLIAMRAYSVVLGERIAAFDSSVNPAPAGFETINIHRGSVDTTSSPGCAPVGGAWQSGNSTTTDGKPPREGCEGTGAPAPINEATGQHEAYWVLSAEERAKGFIRPVRRTYIHKTCGGPTTMGTAIAETYARQPDYYGSTMCVHCRKHFPVGEFHWQDSNEGVGT